MNNKKKLHESMMNNISKSLKSILNEGTYVMTPEDEEYLRQAFLVNEDLPEVCYFLEADGIPAVLDSEYKGDNLSIDSISNNLMVTLSDGLTFDLKDVLNDEDDVETLHQLIIDYADITESRKVGKGKYPRLYKTINEGAVVRQIEQARQFAIRVRNIANNIERDCKDYDETWALGYAEQLKNAAEKMLNTIK